MADANACGEVFASPRRKYPEYPPGSVVEIRVHGIGGEPPSRMARDPHPVLVSGSQLVGFFRARNPLVGWIRQEDSGNCTQPVHVREVLAWGGQTSGTFRHAFWVLLAPFALFNVAGRMHVVGSDRRAAVHRAICRMLALTMTLSVVVVLCGIAFDLLAVQCGGWQQQCLGTQQEGPALLAPLRYFHGDVSGRLGVSALLPVALILALWASGKYGATRLEGHGTDRQREATSCPREPQHLGDLDFWRNAWPTSRLRSLHASTAFAWVGMTLAACLYVIDPSPPFVWLIFIVIQGATVVVALGAAAAPHIARPGPNDGVHALLFLLRLTALGPLAATFGIAVLGHLRTDVSVLGHEVPGAVGAWVLTGLGAAGVLGWGLKTHKIGGREAPDISTWPNVLLAVGAMLIGWGSARTSPTLLTTKQALAAPDLNQHVVSWLPDPLQRLFPGVFAPAYLPLLALVTFQILLLFALALAAAQWHQGETVSRVLRRDRSQLDTGSPVFMNLGAVVVGLLALLLILAVGAAVHALTVEWLGKRVTSETLPFTGEEVGLVLPWWYALIAATVAFLVPIALAVVWLAFGVRRRKDAPSAEVVCTYLEAAYGDQEPKPDAAQERQELDRVAGMWMTQRLIRDGGQMLAWTVATAFAGVAAGMAIGPPMDSWVTTPSVWIVSLIPVAAVAVIRSSLRDSEMRRQVGRMWDVLTFWPRVTHPFAPPCYGEALVPMLEEHVRFLVGDHAHDGVSGQYKVVLACHSQGSVVALAAAARLAPKLKNRVSMVSYGSPIAILYERYYRGAFATQDAQPPHPSIIGNVEDRVYTWHHLFSMTEPFAFPFWQVAEAKDIPGGARSGWKVNLKVPGHGTTCTTCGLGTAAPAVTPRADVLIRDPDLWRMRTGAPGTPGGHSAYHAHTDVDDHIRQVVRQFPA